MIVYIFESIVTLVDIAAQSFFTVHVSKYNYKSDIRNGWAIK